MFPFTDGKEHGLSEEPTKAKEIMQSKSWALDQRCKKRGSLCDTFLLFRDYAECFFL